MLALGYVIHVILDVTLFQLNLRTYMYHDAVPFHHNNIIIFISPFCTMKIIIGLAKIREDNVHLYPQLFDNHLWNPFDNLILYSGRAPELTF